MDLTKEQIQELIKKAGSKEALQDQLAAMSDYKEAVPTIEIFIKDPYYIGKSIGDTLYPIWLDALKKVYPSPYYSPYSEIILSGAIGLGKSTMARIVTLYDICKLLCLKNPHDFYSLTPTTVISYALMNATQGLSKKVLYDEIIQMIELSPFFKSRLDLNKKARTLFKGNIDIDSGSRGRDMLGTATIGAIFSEINDMNVVKGQASDTFDTISTRRSSRFSNKGSEVIGHLILDSSSKGSTSFIDLRVEEKRKKGIRDYIIFAYTHWEANWHIRKYSNEWFKVYAGDESRDPFIFKDIEDRIDDSLLESLDKSRIIEVPVEHYNEFKFNIVKSLRDLAGISTFSTFAFISSIEALNNSINHINPVKKDIIMLDFFDKGQHLMQFFELQNLISMSNKPRYIHIDLGLKNDSTGIACCYLDRYRDVIIQNSLTGEEIINKEPVYFVEWVLEIIAKPGSEVPIYKIKNFIFEARDMGYPIKLVSTDGYQSENLRQDLKLAGIETNLVSMDRTKAPYDNLKNSINEGRIDLPRNEKLRRELINLEDTGKKYDHPEDCSKDISDAVAGCVWSCLQGLGNLDSMSPDHLIDVLDAFMAINKPSKPNYAGFNLNEIFKKK